MNDVQFKMGQRIKALREKADMSQKDLSYAADLDRSYIANIENGQRNVSIIYGKGSSYPVADNATMDGRNSK